jgi:hypothetical protein
MYGGTSTCKCQYTSETMKYSSILTEEYTHGIEECQLTDEIPKKSNTDEYNNL